MKRRLKKIALTTGVVLLLLAVVAAVVVRFIDVDRYRPEIEAAISEATGLDCSLGKLSLSLWPFLNLRIAQPALGHAGQPVLKAERITASAYLLPLLSRRLELRAITITKLTGTIRRDRHGNLNLLPPRKPKPEKPIALPITALKIAKIILDNTDLRYEDATTGFTAATKGMNLAIGPFLIMDRGKTLMASGRDFLAASWDGSLKATTITLNALPLDRPALQFTAADNNLILQPITATVYGGKLEGSLTVSGLGENPQLATAVTINSLDLARLSAAVNHKGQVTGRLHVATTLTTNGAKRQTMLRRLNGTVAMHGSDLTIENIDLDTILTQYAKSQEIGLLDLGSIFIAGPFGPLLSKAIDLSGTALGVGRGSSRLTQLVSEWTIRNGIATTRDVAFASPKHRLAMSGQLDFPTERFLGFRVGVLDQRGCATFTQTVNGSFRDPQVEKTGLIAKTIVNPLLSLFRKGAAAISGDKPTCTPFYQGRVPHPVTP